MPLLELTDAQLTSWLGAWLWPLFRVMGFVMTVPLLGSNFVPMRVRLVLALAITLPVAPLVGPLPVVEALSIEAILIVLQQVLIGAALGFFLQIVFQIFVLTGQMIAMQMGLGFAAMVDPSTGVNTAVLSTFYLMFASLLFISFDGHLIMIRILAESFQTLPVAASGVGDTFILQILSTISWAFSSALVLALPAVTALLMTNFAFGIMTRAAPQMNIFALGFPSALMLGLFVVWLLTGTILESINNLFAEAFAMMRGMTGS